MANALDPEIFRIAPKGRPDRWVSHQALSSSTGVTMTSKARLLTVETIGLPSAGTRIAGANLSACVAPNGSHFLESCFPLAERRLLIGQRIEALPQQAVVIADDPAIARRVLRAGLNLQGGDS